MIKRITMLLRKTGTTRAAFRTYWHENHGKIVLQMTAVAGYVQNPVLEDGAEDIGLGPPFQFDGVVELWFADAAAQAEAFATPAAKRLPIDEPNFIEGITILTIQEEEVVQGRSTAKAILVIGTNPSLHDGQRSALLREIETAAQALPGIRRMVANRVVGHGRRDGLWAEPVPPDLILELGAASPTRLSEMIESPAFDAIRRVVTEQRGRLAVRRVEERRVI